MKKLAIATAITLAAGAASALDLSVVSARDYAGGNRSAVGVSVGQKIGAVTVAAGFDRATAGSNDQDRYSLMAGVDVAKVGPVTVALKAGGAYLNNQTGDDGYAALVGVGASLPITKQMSLTLDATHQYGQNRVQAFDGNRVTAGVKYRF